MSKRSEDDLKDFNFFLDTLGNLNLSYNDLRDGNRQLNYNLAIILEDGVRFGAHFFRWKEWNKVMSNIKIGREKMKKIKTYKESVKLAQEELNKIVEEK